MGLVRAYNQSKNYVVKDVIDLKILDDRIKMAKDGHSDLIVIKISKDDDITPPPSHHLLQAPPTEALPSPPLTDARPLAFWNLSKHPSTGWTEAQRAAALELAPGAEVIDVPFPDVDPNLDTSALKAAAAAVVKGWGAPSAGERRVVAAMVAGEPLMCVELVEALEARGVRCYSATTLEEVDGEKRSRLEFVRFRAWRA